MAIFTNKLIFASAAVFVIVSINGVHSQLVPQPILILRAIVNIFTRERLPACHNPFEYHTGYFSTGTLDGYSSEPFFIAKYSLVGWYYSSSELVCRPLYLRADVEPYEGNNLVPKSKDECDTKCGRSCMYTVSQKASRYLPTYYKEGVYSLNEYCVGGNHSAVCNNDNCSHKISAVVSCCEKHFNSIIKPIPTIVNP